MPNNMDRWRNKVAVVTGASSGIGAALVKDLVNEGLTVIGLARRDERVLEIRKQLKPELQGHLNAFKCDVSSEEDVISAFAWIEKKFGGVDILINNAGVLRLTELIKPNNTKDIKDTIDTNILGVVYCTREGFNSMKNRGVDGHIVIINSVGGHIVPNFGKDIPSFNIYAATKFAVTAMTETYRQEFLNSGTKIKITSISPGGVDTNIFPTEIEGMIKSTMPLLRPEDVSNAIIFALGTPPHVQIHELTIKPVGELV